MSQKLQQTFQLYTFVSTSYTALVKNMPQKSDDYWRSDDYCNLTTQTKNSKSSLRIMIPFNTTHLSIHSPTSSRAQWRPWLTLARWHPGAANE